RYGFSAPVGHRTLDRLERAHDGDPLGGAGDGLLPVPDALDKMVAFGLQRFPEGYFRDRDVSLAYRPAEGRERVGERGDRPLFCHALVVDAKRLIDVHVVEREHVMFADDRDIASFPWVEPAHVEVYEDV